MQRKRQVAILLSILLVFITGCNAGGQLPGNQDTPRIESTPTIELPANMPDPGARNSAQALENVVTAIYDALANGQRLDPYINGVMAAFEVPPLGEADLALVQERYSKGLPLMFLPQVAEMADAYIDGGYVTLDSFITAANNRGATQEGTDEPLTREYLTLKFGEYAGKAQYEAGQVLPAFVLALGQERARRFPPENADPLWGDGLLDPLQLTLLLYSVSYSGAGRLPAQASWTADIPFQDGKVSFSQDAVQASLSAGTAASDPITDWIKDQIQDEITGEIQDFIEVPLDKADAAQASVCASLLLYGHKLKVTNTPDILYHKDGEKPWTTRVDVTLTFQDDYWGNYLQIDRWVLENLGGCNLPHRGPVAGKPLEWSVSEELNDHGNFNITPSQTNGLGQASASWQTVPETTPRPQRTPPNQHSVGGTITVRAGSLVPGWSGLERIVGALKDTGNTGGAALTVNYYTGEAYKATGQGGVESYTGLICDLEKPFTLKADIGAYNMTVNFKPSNKNSGFFDMSGTIDLGNSVTSVTGAGPYTVKRVDGEATQLILTFSEASGYNSVAGGGQESGFQLFIDLAPLDTPECD